jgi:hypothetical protein
VDLAAGGAGTTAIVSWPMLIRKLWSPAAMVTILRAWIMPTWILWVATMIWPRCETRRWTVVAEQQTATAALI